MSVAGAPFLFRVSFIPIVAASLCVAGATVSRSAAGSQEEMPSTRREAAPPSGALTPEQQLAIRKAIPLPNVEVGVVFSFSSRRGFSLSEEDDDDARLAGQMLKDLQRRPLPKSRLARAERLLEVSHLHRERDEDAAAHKAAVDALARFQRARRASLRPGDTTAIRAEVGYASALLAVAGDGSKAPAASAEAIRTLRNAAKIAPRNPDLWAGLAAAHTARNPFEEVLGGSEAARVLKAATQRGSTAALPSDAATRAEIGAKLRQGFGSEDRKRALARVEARYAEAVRCLDRAVALAPRRADLYLARAVARGTPAILRILAAGGPAAPSDTKSALFSTMLGPESLRDIQTAARLTPNDPAALAAATVFPVLVRVLQHSDSSEDWDPKKVRLQVQSAIREIDRRMASQRNISPEDRARALEVSAIFYAMQQEFGPAAERAKRSLSLAPMRAGSAEMLVGALSETGRTAEAIPILRSRLAVRERARDRVLLAKAYAAAGREEEAVATLGQGRLRAAKGIGTPSEEDRRLLDFAHLATLMRSGAGGTVRFVQATALLDRLESRAAPYTNEERELLRLFRATHGVLAGGDPEDARRAFTELAEEDGDYSEEAEKLRDALPPAPVTSTVASP